MNFCDDNRIITIEKAKQSLIKGTNIEDSPEEMKVLDNILFRCWQMGWLDRYDPQKKQPITEDKIKAWLDGWEGYIDADMIARMKYRVIDIRNVQLSQAAADINVGHKAAGHGSNVPMQPSIPPMPSNTSNALKALNSVNATQFNALDSISRQAAIKALDKRFDSIPMEQTTAILLLRRDLRELPPTNTSEFPNSSDTISRKEAIEAADAIIERDKSGNNAVVNAMIAWREYIKYLQPSRPAQTERKWILCNERMPEEQEWIGTKDLGTTISDEVYVTFENPKGEGFCKELNFQNGKLSAFDKSTIDAFYKGSKPIAWTPKELPEPYKGVTK